jgi:hypothetical protein
VERGERVCKTVTYGSVGALEGRQHRPHEFPDARACALVHGFDRLADFIPYLLVLVAEDERNAHGLRVVRRGRKRQHLLHNLLDARVRDGRRVLEAVDGAADRGGVQPLVRADGSSVGHCDAGCFFSE